MGLREAYIGVRTLEVSSNYARVEIPLPIKGPSEDSLGSGMALDYGEQQFWSAALNDQRDLLPESIQFWSMSISDWVARVPGLYWKSGSAELRKASPAMVEKVSNSWTQYSPPMKSAKVMGGIGTLRLPPATDGTRLITLTGTCNVSAGIPALVSPDVWQKVKRVGPVEGRLIDGTGHWQAMAEGWATHFPSTRSVPRGYIVLDDPDQLLVRDSRAPNQFHPFTIMEYRAGAKLLYDFVYATADTGEPDHRRQLERFFDQYKSERERHGRYLLASDMVDSLWEAEFNGPADLMRNDHGRTRLDLLNQRVRERMIGSDGTEMLLEALGKVCTVSEDVLRLSKEIGVQSHFWDRGGTVAEMINQFVIEAHRSGLLEQLLETVALEYPALVKTPNHS